MKKIVILLLVVMLTAGCLTACACSKDTDKKPNTNSQQPDKGNTVIDEGHQIGTDSSAGDNVNESISGLMQSIFDVQPGTAGSGERTESMAKSFVAFTTDYAEKMNVTEIAAAVGLFLQEKGADDDRYFKKFQQAFDAVREEALRNDPSLETEVGFQQLVNGIQMGIDDVKSR